ncbi:hypothetical protein ACFQ3P_04450 [Paraburkholderia sabiae]|uniref:Uncharacterized protein n=1 Tax=Paraburkholderia sabiae TaxID=273251 RepID=A0ABU9QMH8_9BURK|nr:hypothetical protein [Paraburkholderia sabiae]WJZ79116.1 hypothetical protein QEN71_34660 [Paraburkholderia sabiae]CAD6514330.1 hypothetical protein LMG24235_00892 [Paraburkholderia sabiae]
MGIKTSGLVALGPCSSRIPISQFPSAIMKTKCKIFSSLLYGVAAFVITAPTAYLKFWYASDTVAANSPYIYFIKVVDNLDLLTSTSTPSEDARRILEAYNCFAAAVMIGIATAGVIFLIRLLMLRNE